ncbi:hypothetical protein JTB14_008217 [Gonioctena quinquepunctata]|nr:hypothetical protein JTB14_008217 [Gonioctena quinquepunctata]
MFRFKNKTVIEDIICDIRSFIMNLFISRANDNNAPPEVFKFGEKSKERKILQPRTSTSSKPSLRAEKHKVVGVVRKREHNEHCSACIAKENPVVHKNTCRHASASMGIPEAKKMRTSLTGDAVSASNKSSRAENVFPRLCTSRKRIRGSKENVTLCRRSFSSKNASNDSVEKINSVVVKKEEQGVNRRSYPFRLPRNSMVLCLIVLVVSRML